MRRLGHLSLLARDVSAILDLLPEAPGSRVTERIMPDSGEVDGGWLTINRSYDIAYPRDRTDAGGRFRHLTYDRFAVSVPARA